MSDNFPADKDWEEAEFRARVLAELPVQLSSGLSTGPCVS